jgi:hypothetical protein
MMIDTNRTDTYVEIGSADKPFKTFAAAITAVATLNPTGTVPYTFVLMGCEIDETVDFTPYNFNFITISTTCRSVFNNPVIFGNSALLQLTVRNVEFGDTVTITGDGTANQLNNTSFYNVSFTGALTVTAANALAFYEAAFFSTVTFNNVNYVYVNGGQFNSDWTIRADNTGAYAVPANGITPGQIIALDFIANNINFVKGGTGTYVFQPQGSRMGLSAGTYTLPAGWTLSAYSSVFRGTWTNNGTWTMRNSSNDNAIANVAPTYSGTIGGAILSASGNITGGNIRTAGLITATGNITGGNLTLSSTTGNIIAHDITLGGNVSATANVTGGNILTAGVVSATGNITAGNLSVTGNVIGTIGFTGASITINNAPGGNEGAEIQWALPSPANTVLNTSLVQDVFQNGMRFFESGGNSRGLYMDLGNVPNGAGTAVGYRDIPQVSFTANATLAATDAGRHYYSTLATANVLTIANNTSVSWTVGTAISIVNRGSGNITIAQGSGVSLYLAGNSTPANRTVTTYGMATLLNVAANVWMINGTGVS